MDGRKTQKARGAGSRCDDEIRNVAIADLTAATTAKEGPGSAEASGFAAASEALLVVASAVLASPEPPDRESLASTIAGERARTTARIHPKNKSHSFLHQNLSVNRPGS